MDEAKFIEWAKHLSMEPVLVAGKIQGILAVSGDKLHVAVSPSAKGRWLRQLQRFIEKQGRNLIAVTAAQDRNARQFIERCGCLLLREDTNTATYDVDVSKLWFSRG